MDTLAEILQDVALVQHGTGVGSVYSWSCQLCPSWGHGATTEHAALTEIADHRSLYCEAGPGGE